MAKNHWILPTHSDVTSKVGLTLAEPPCILDGIPDGGSHGNEKILEDAYQLIVKYSDICSVDVAYLQMILKTCTNTLKNLLSSYSVSPTMLFVVKLRSANFLLNEDCIVLYCIAIVAVCIVTLATSTCSVESICRRNGSQCGLLPNYFVHLWSTAACFVWLNRLNGPSWSSCVAESRWLFIRLLVDNTVQAC